MIAKRKGMTLPEILCCISIIPIVLLGIIGGLNTMRNIQYRTDCTTRLTNAAASVMETWKAKKFDEIKTGTYSASFEGLKQNDKISVTVSENKNKYLKEISVKAIHEDAKLPLELVLTTYISR